MSALDNRHAGSIPVTRSTPTLFCRWLHPLPGRLGQFTLIVAVETFLKESHHVCVFGCEFQRFGFQCDGLVLIPFQEVWRLSSQPRSISPAFRLRPFQELHPCKCVQIKPFQDWLGGEVHSALGASQSQIKVGMRDGLVSGQ